MQIHSRTASVLLAVCAIVFASARVPAVFAQDGFDSSVARPMTADALKARIAKGEKVVIVDARSELDGEIIKNAVHVPDEQLVAWSDTAPKDVPIVIYCTCEHDEAAIGEVLGLQNLGFTNAYVLEGGLAAAKKAGIDVVTPPSE